MTEMGRHSSNRLSLALLFQFTGWVSVLWVSEANGKAVPGRCSLFGQHHIHTFDGVLYEFPGDCSYMLAGDCHRRSFSLLGDFRHGKRRGVTVYLGEFFELHLSVDGRLMQGENRMTLPYASSTIFAGTELGYYKLWSEEFGFEVKIDGNGNINLMLSKHHTNRTCGLCGNFNSLAEDDYTAQEGFQTKSSYDFANSWAMHGAEEPCHRVSPPSKTCNTSKGTAADLMSRCDALRSSPSFLRCAHMVDPEAFALLCEEDACHCGEDQACRCQAFLEYARSCASHGLPLHGWQTKSQCSPSCPAGMQYSECTSPCSTTCQSLNIHEVCREECVDGCNCPAGKVLETDRCVDVSQCSCMHTGRRYPPGSSIPQDCNTCVCRHGSWECTNEGCPGECFVTGQSHFKTFDNKFFTFSGTCQYLFAKDCQDNLFAAAIETVQCADDQDAVCTRSATVRFHKLANMTVKLKHGGVVAVDGMDIQTPLTHGPLQIKRTVLSSLRLSYGDDFQLDWDGRGKLLMKLGPAFAGKMCGLCGNYNGNQGDDFLTAAGLVETRVEGFGNSWKMNGECHNVVKQDTDPCALNPKRVRFAEESCSVVLSVQFEPCHNEVNPAPFLKNCRYDVCSCTDGQECLCSAVASYAAACASKGVLVNWRSPKFCKLSCPGDQVYEQCGSPCNQSCRSLSFPDTDCRDLCLEGCYCPRGLFHSDESGECVLRSECPCYFDGEIYHPNDVFSDYQTICYCENGAMRCSSNEMPAAMLSDLFAEDLPAARARRSVSCQPPLQNLVCSSPREEGIECTKTCQNYDLECVSQGCISGCTCPSGMVRHRRDCITPDQCPCYHNNKAYAPGQTVAMDCNTCVCRNRKWECSQNMCDGSCKTVGDAHYITFDGLKYSFPGLCQYVLVQDYCNGDHGTFRVLVESTGCGVLGHKCAKSVTVLYQGGLITMEQGEVKMKKPVLRETEVEIVRSGLYYILLLGKDIVITWDMGTRLVVQIKGRYREKVCGLCGNFDGIQNNDLLSSNNQLEVDAADFGNSWKVNPSCADAVQLPSQCSDNTLKLVTVEQSCHVLTSPLFRECNVMVNSEPYWEICTHDTCSCPSVGDCVCFCDAIAAYAHECAQKGIVVNWRSNDLCPMSCQDLNKAEPEFECEWRYNSCASACPITCQHPEPLQCPQECVEGCHAYCPEGKILDEVAMQCVDPAQCQVCMHEGQRVSHGKKIVLNHNDPEHCQICHCVDSKLTCEKCPTEVGTTLAPTTFSTTPTPMPFSTPVPEDTCDRAMDLAFLVDGSSALTEEDFEQVKLFILGVADRFRMGSAHTRATVLLFHSGVKSYEMQVQKWIYKRMVREMKYSGGDVAFMDEAIKYLSVFIYDKDKREHAGRVAIILTASTNPRPMKMTQRLLKKKDITTLTIALGPDASMAQIDYITKANPSSRAYILSSVEELDVRTVEVIDYLCTLGLEPEIPTPKPKPTIRAPATTSPTTPGLSIHIIPTQQILRPPAPTTGAPITAGVLATTPSSKWAIKNVTFIIEGSDKVGEADFNKTREFLEEAVSELTVSEEYIRITIIQYSYTVTVEFTQREAERRSVLLERIRQIRWRGGGATNTGNALRTVSQTSSTHVQNPQEQKPQLVFMVTSNPPTDTIQRPAESTHTIIYPIGVGQKIKEVDLEPLSFPKKPIMVDSYNDLRSVIKRVVNITRFTNTIIRPLSPTLPPRQPTLTPRTTLPPSVPCEKPMDVIFLLKESFDGVPNQFYDMKNFVKAFIHSATIGSGSKGTQVSVIQYGERNTEDVSWREEQSRENLLSLVDSIVKRRPTPATLGSALRIAVQSTISSASGGRPGVAKIVVMLVTERSTDSVVEAANEALTAGVSVFPIGIGSHYDGAELNALAGHGMESNTIHLKSMEDLLVMVALGHTFIDKLCRAGPPGVCVDDNGNQRKPGETWILSDQCHSLLCHPNGAVTMQSHRVNCEHMERPACKNNLRSVKVPEPCGCRWACPCMCMGSSTNHVVTFDGLALKLNGFCSYTLLRAEGAGGTEVLLHSGPCKASPNQICMKAMEVKVGEVSVVLKDNMTVTIDGLENPAPFKIHGVEVTQYGAVMHQLKVVELGYLVAFTPQNNEFTIQLSPTMVSNKTTGLCGYCDQDERNDLALPNGSLTSDSEAVIRAWTLPEADGAPCQPGRNETCAHPVTDRCQVLHSPVFAPCHAAVRPEPFFDLCRQNGCHSGEICDLVSAYGRLCRLQGVCVSWRTPDFCPMPCPSSMVFDSCRTGCVEECGSSSRPSPGDDITRGDGNHGGNGPLCMDTPTEGCFCPPGEVLHSGVCVSPDACSQCLDQHGRAFQYLETWVPLDKPCQICMCLDNQHINCTARPCTDSKAPECGPCEVLREKRESHCCPEYECVCDLVTCDLPEIPRCEDGLTIVLTNPGECRPIHECACKREQCALEARPPCPPHRRLAVKKTQCCDAHECVCDCQNSTRTCPPGYLTSSATNDCDCTDVTCAPDKVCVVSGVVYQVGSEWEESCKTCSCTDHQDGLTGLHIVQCVDKVCNQICPMGSTYSRTEGECCGKCRKSSCLEKDEGGPMGDMFTGGHLRLVGERWRSPANRCMVSECVQVNDEVFISHSNVSCRQLDAPSCPLGTELHCSTDDCCPTCQCVPLDGCLMNHTVIGVGEKLMVDLCTNCQCSVEKGALTKYRLSCRRITCNPCPEGYTQEAVPDACCGRCVATSCRIQRPDGRIISLQANQTHEDGCSFHHCRVNKNRELVLETRITTCQPFNRANCLDEGGKVSQIGSSCCEMCTEPECKKTTGVLNYIKVDDCQSEHQLDLHYCEGKCRSKAMFSLEKNRVTRECVCCAATATSALTVPLRCTNGTLVEHQVLTVNACDCQSQRCEDE